MTSINVNRDVIKNLFKLYTDYKQAKVLSAAEYINSLDKLSDEEVAAFLALTKHQKFLETLTEILLILSSFRRVNQSHAEIVMFLIIFALNEDNFDTILESLLKINCYYLCELVASIVDVSKHLLICKTACKFFDNDYVLSEIIEPFLNKIIVVAKLGKEYLKKHELKPTATTKVKEFQFSKSFYRKPPCPPSNTPIFKRHFRASEAPATTQKPHRFNALKSRIENRKRAEQLLVEASQMPERLVKHKVTYDSDEDTIQAVFKSKPPPHFKKVQVKGNLTTTLREAARVVRENESEAQEIDNLIKGGLGKDDINKLEEQLKKERELKMIETIEKNHLKGLLSHEEALLAKRKLLETNKQKREQIKEEKLELLKQLDIWREGEEQKIRNLVEKCQNIKQGARESENKLLEQKRELVRIQQYETKQLLEQALAERKKELARKMELIQEIKAIHQVRCNIKEFDPTEAPNLGLLCEMSIAELQERLTITKMNMKKELEEKRQGILKKKEEHRLMIENVKKMIKQSRIKRSPVVATENILPVQESEDVAELRRQLELKRKLRLDGINLS